MPRFSPKLRTGTVYAYTISRKLGEQECTRASSPEPVRVGRHALLRAGGRRER